jgi:hypothetical protein
MGGTPRVHGRCRQLCDASNGLLPGISHACQSFPAVHFHSPAGRQQFMQQDRPVFHSSVNALEVVQPDDAVFSSPARAHWDGVILVSILVLASCLSAGASADATGVLVCD